MRTQFQQQRFGLLVVLGVGAVGRQAEVVQGNRQHLRRRVEHGHAAFAEFRQVLFLEHQVPGIHRRLVTQQRAHFVDVVADTVGAPQVGYGVLVARIVVGQFRQQFGVHVLEVRHLRTGQGGEGAGLDQRGQTEVAGHHHVVAAAAGEQLAFEHFGAVEGVVDRCNPGVTLEVLQGGGADVVVPVVHVHGRGFDRKSRQRNRQTGTQPQIEIQAVTTHDAALLACCGRW
ncbi:hypothetical protein D3C80_1096890 [compost metagenome]